MSEKTMRIIGWVFMDLVCVAILFFTLFYGLNSDTLNISIYIGVAIELIPIIVITFIIGRATVSLSKDPVERLNEAMAYQLKLLKEDEKNGKEKK